MIEGGVADIKNGSRGGTSHGRDGWTGVAAPSALEKVTLREKLATEALRVGARRGVIVFQRLVDSDRRIIDRGNLANLVLGSVVASLLDVVISISSPSSGSRSEQWYRPTCQLSGARPSSIVLSPASGSHRDFQMHRLGLAMNLHRTIGHQAAGQQVRVGGRIEITVRSKHDSDRAAGLDRRADPSDLQLTGMVDGQRCRESTR